MHAHTRMSVGRIAQWVSLSYAQTDMATLQAEGVTHNGNGAASHLRLKPFALTSFSRERLVVRTGFSTCRQHAIHVNAAGSHSVIRDRCCRLYDAL